MYPPAREGLTKNSMSKNYYPAGVLSLWFLIHRFLYPSKITSAVPQPTTSAAKRNNRNPTTMLAANFRAFGMEKRFVFFMIQYLA